MEEKASSVSSLVAPNMLKGDAQGNASVMEGLTSSVLNLVAPNMLKASQGNARVMEGLTSSVSNLVAPNMLKASQGNAGNTAVARNVLKMVATVMLEVGATCASNMADTKASAVPLSAVPVKL
jgi:hypothetical protein